MAQRQKSVYKLTAALWVFWGLVHAFAGVMTISLDTPAAIAGIADAIDPAVLTGPYHKAAGALINQHGFNLLWIGLFTVIGGVFIWRGNKTWLFFTAVVGGLTDIGFFVFIDIGGFANFVPGTVMTIVSGTAIVLSLWVWIIDRHQGESHDA
ncbi:MAG: hypothetical protein AAF127_00130 [Pseudomonadota bacterium]